MEFHLFTQSNENDRTFAQHRAISEEAIANVVVIPCSCSTTATPPPPLRHDVACFFPFYRRQRSFLLLSGTQYLGVFVKTFLREDFSSLFCLCTFSACTRFFNRIPDYVLATQHCTESQCIAYHFSDIVTVAASLHLLLLHFTRSVVIRISLHISKYFQGDSVASLSFLASHFWMIEERVEWKQCKDVSSRTF